MKRVYVGVARLLGRALTMGGVMKVLDRWAASSRTGLWVRSWFAIHDLDQMVALGVPWWTFEAIDLVEDHLARADGARVLEWGSGASTVWLAARSSSVISIEHDVAWAERMATRLPANAQVLVIPPVPSAQPRTASRKPGFGGQDFSAYVAGADALTTRFDVVVIDGRAREACLPRALARLADGGVVVFDNVDRGRYREAIAAYGDRLDVRWTRGATPSLPYPTRTALIRIREKP